MTHTVTDFDTFAAHFPRPSAGGFHAKHPTDWEDRSTPKTDRPAAFLTTRIENGWNVRRSHIAR